MEVQAISVRIFLVGPPPCIIIFIEIASGSPSRVPHGDHAAEKKKQQWCRDERLHNDQECRRPWYRQAETISGGWTNLRGFMLLSPAGAGCTTDSARRLSGEYHNKERVTSKSAKHCAGCSDAPSACSSGIGICRRRAIALQQNGVRISRSSLRVSSFLG